jgi:hypothetical protein
MWRSLLPVLCLVAGLGCASPISPSITDGPTPYPDRPTFLDIELEGCPPESAIADITEVAVTFGEAVTTGPLVCTVADGSRDLTERQRRAYWGLIMMKRLRYSEPLPWTNRSLYDWFTSTVQLVIFDASGDYSRASASRRLIIIEQNPPPAGGTPVPELPWATISRLVGGFVHEARHVEGYRHTCGNDDRTVAEMGAFGVHNLYMVWNGTHSDPSIVPVEWRRYHLYKACVQRRSAFCDEPKNVRCE